MGINLFNIANLESQVRIMKLQEELGMVTSTDRNEATFACLYFAGITINMMTLGGLTLAMGRLVDDNIVALENIHRHRQEGYSKVDAAIKGVSEVGMAIFASTLTTVAVFLPIVFVQGIVATIFRELAMTFAISLMASLLVSLTLVPTLSAKLMQAEDSLKCV